MIQLKTLNVLTVFSACETICRFISILFSRLPIAFGSTNFRIISFFYFFFYVFLNEQVGSWTHSNIRTHWRTLSGKSFWCISQKIIIGLCIKWIAIVPFSFENENRITQKKKKNKTAQEIRVIFMYCSNAFQMFQFIAFQWPGNAISKYNAHTQCSSCFILSICICDNSQNDSNKNRKIIETEHRSKLNRSDMRWLMNHLIGRL